MINGKKNHIGKLRYQRVKIFRRNWSCCLLVVGMGMGREGMCWRRGIGLLGKWRNKKIIYLWRFRGLWRVLGWSLIWIYLIIWMGLSKYLMKLREKKAKEETIPQKLNNSQPKNHNLHTPTHKNSLLTKNLHFNTPQNNLQLPSQLHTQSHHQFRNKYYKNNHQIKFITPTCTLKKI